MIKRLGIFAFLCSVLFLTVISGCTSADDVIFNETESPDYISVQAFVAHTMDSSSTSSKADTINPGDSLIFLTYVYPSKSIRSKNYYWTMDGYTFSFEYNFKRAVYDPGRHEINFVFIDYFGDTLTDTVYLCVGSRPILDTNNFIPAKGMQKIDPNTFINFTWNVTDPDKMWNMAHHFILKEAEGSSEHPKVLVDTVLNQAYFSYLNGFSPLSHYEWEVYTTNELGQVSEDTIRGNISTKGVSGENAAYGFISHTSTDKSLPIHQRLINSFGGIIYEEIHDNSKGTAFSLKPISEGNYTLISSIDGYPDFSIDTTRFSISGNEVLLLDTIKLVDAEPPQISAFDGSDTLTYADTLKVFLQDQGGNVVNTRIRIQFESKSISDFHLSNDTLSIYIPELKTSWTYKIISISALDQSGNRNTKNLYITPATTLTEVFSE